MMDIQTRKIEFVQEFLKLTNEELISKFEKLLRKSNADDDLKPFTVDELNERITKSEKDFETGNYISSEELTEEIKNW